jgi:hypothetical protein
MNDKLRKTVTLYLLIQVFYLTQIYPYVHFHAHTGSEGIHLDFVSHLVVEHGDPEADLLIPHQHAVVCHSDEESSNEESDHHHEPIVANGDELSTHPDHCDFQEYHHRYGSTFQLPTFHNQYSISAHVVVVSSEQFQDNSISILAFDKVERGPPDDNFLTLQFPRPPPAVA